jgi:hypothetical protein
MNRISWFAQRRRVRDSYPTRAERGLPKHPDGSGLAPCPRCGSEGCGLCDGTTFITDGYRDPLLRLRYARQPYVRRRDPRQYQHLRQVIAATRHPLRLIEAAVGAELAARGAVQAFRSAP